MAGTNLLDGKVVVSETKHTEVDSGVGGLRETSIDSGVLGLPELSVDSAIQGITEDLSFKILSGIKGVAVEDLDIDSGIEGLALFDADSGVLGKEFLGIGSAIIGGVAGEVPGDSVWATFNSKLMDGVSAVSSQGDLVTVLRILFDYDYGTRTFRKAVQLEAVESIRKYGRIEKEIQAYWISSFRSVVQMGERQLKYYARPKWSISFTTSLDYADIPSGEWVILEEHPLLPVFGSVLVSDASLDLSAGEVSFVVEKVVGDPVKTEITRLSEAFEPEILEGLSITYKDGVATFTILDELGDPLAGASVMLDGDAVHTTDGLGRVQFRTTRGRHRLLVEATGYAPLEFEVEV